LESGVARYIEVRSESGGLFSGWVIRIGPKGGGGALEFLGLRVKSLPEGNSQKMQMEPLGQETGGNGHADTPGSYGSQWELCRSGFRKELSHGPGNTADLHPSFQYCTLLLPEVVDALPALEVVEDRFDLPAVAIG